jgi:hypothetical protein
VRPNSYYPVVYQNNTQQISATQFANTIGVTRQVVCKWIREGRLPGCDQQSNGYYLIPSHYIEEYRAGELPLAPVNVRRHKLVAFTGKITG